MACNVSSPYGRSSRSHIFLLGQHVACSRHPAVTRPTTRMETQGSTFSRLGLQAIHRRCRLWSISFQIFLISHYFGYMRDT
jgi:hypothetical protein